MNYLTLYVVIIEEYDNLKIITIDILYFVKVVQVPVSKFLEITRPDPIIHNVPATYIPYITYILFSVPIYFNNSETVHHSNSDLDRYIKVLQKLSA